MSNAKFKHSGIEWLGEIPKHWEAWRLRDIFEIKNGYTPSKANQEFWENGTLPWFRMDDIRTNGRILNDSLQHITQKAVEPNGLFPANSLIIATTATIGEHALITVDSLANQQFTFLIKKVNCKVELDMKFVFYYGYVLGAWCKSNVNVSNFPAVDMDRFKVFKIPLPPLAEQKQIAEFLDSKCEKIAEFIDKKQKLIALLKEQKQALINECVCGRFSPSLTRGDSKSPCGVESLKSPLPCETTPNKSPLPCRESSFYSPSLAEGARGWVKTDKNPSHRPLASYMKEFSREMRKNPTEAENKLWQELRGKKLGFRFRRQFVIDSKYIADFICLEKRLIIECDGGQHATSPCEVESNLIPLPCEGQITDSPPPLRRGIKGVGKDSLNHPDIQRDFYLESHNFRILRFWNNEILENLEGVLCVIKNALESDLDSLDFADSTHPLAPSAREGESMDCHADFDKSVFNDDRNADCHEFANANSRNDALPCHTDTPLCHTERSEVSKNYALCHTEGEARSIQNNQNRDISPTAQYDKDNYTTQGFKFKPSGVEWLGEIPAHWEIVKGKRLHKCPKILNVNNSCKEVLSLTLRGVIDNDIENPQGLIPKDYATYQIFEKDDLVFKLIDLENISTSRVGLVHKRGIMSPAYIRLQIGKKCHTKFIYYFYYSLYLNLVFNHIGSGVRQTLNSNDLLEIELPLPPFNEQKQIAEFLDSKCEKIDKAIALIEREIESIKEYKTSLIDNAVRGKINV